MSEHIKLHASDGHDLDAYVAHPEDEPIAGLVVIQEIFGVNAHIRSVADAYAKDGFLTIAPALFDRVERNVELTYDGPDMQKAMSFIPKLDADKAIADIATAIDWVSATCGKVGVIGFCWGGTLAWIAACRLPVAAAVGYYGGRIGNYAQETPHAPVMLHFGRQDTHIPAEEVAKVQAAHPSVEVHWYDAGHGFNCDARASFNLEAAKQARERSLNFLTRNLG